MNIFDIKDKGSYRSINTINEHPSQSSLSLSRVGTTKSLVYPRNALSKRTSLPRISNPVSIIMEEDHIMKRQKPKITNLRSKSVAKIPSGRFK